MANQNNTLTVDIKEIIKASKAINDLALIQIEQTEQAKQQWFEAFKSLAERVELALQLEKAEEIKDGFKDILEVIKQQKQG